MKNAFGFSNRREAGAALAETLPAYAEHPDSLVLALPRGGVPVAREVAKKLRLPMDLWLVRKLGAPGHEEYAMGAIAAGGIQVLNEALIHDMRIDRSDIDSVLKKEEVELARRNAKYRGGRPPADVAGKNIIVVDDGLATGATMRAAVLSLRKAGAGKIIVAAPVCANAAACELEKIADLVVCVSRPEPFFGVGQWYKDFSQTTDEEVLSLLGREGDAMLNYDPDREVVAALEKHILPWAQAGWDYHPLMNAAEGKRFVLIGEATHGTAEFYRIRGEITKSLIMEKGFDAVAVEADWPDAYRLNRYVCNRSGDADANQALSGFQRFPAWMWRNKEVLDFAEWLRGYNETSRSAAEAVGFYGLDIYNMTASIQAVLSYLDKVDANAAAVARERYACFGQFINDPTSYGHAIASGVWDSCEKEVIGQLKELRRAANLYVQNDGEFASDEYFCAQENAELVRSAEEYYRALWRGRPNAWNLRDRHMFGTLERLAWHLQASLGRPPRIAVWAHNSHLGNAAATDASGRSEINIGQLVSEKYEKEALRIGFSTSSGTVTAASDWDMPSETKTISPPLLDSYEALFSRLKEKHFFIDLREKNEAVRHLAHERLQRAIGVVYRPDTERQSHYYYACLPRQFDFMIHIDETEALEPLATYAYAAAAGLDETYPSGL